jgi:hypothetical protein
MSGDWHPCRLDFKNCTYTVADGLKENCAECNPHTPPAPVDSSIRPGAGAASTPRVTVPPPARGVLNGDAAARGGEAAPAASLEDLQRRWVR